MAGRRAPRPRPVASVQPPAVEDPIAQRAFDVLTGAVQDLQSRVALGLFTGDQDGYVSASGGSADDVLCGDGTWRAASGVGAVLSVSAGSSAVTVSPTTGAVVVDVVEANFTGIPQSGVTSLVADLAGKAATVHTHAESDITGLVADLAAINTTLAGVITGVTAGTNLSGGGSSGDVTLDVVASPSFTSVTATASSGQAFYAPNGGALLGGATLSGGSTALIVDGTSAGTAAWLNATGGVALKIAGTLTANATTGSNGEILQVVAGLPVWDVPATASITTGSGTTDTIPKWTSSSALGDSQLAISGYVVRQQKVSTQAFFAVGDDPHVNTNGQSGLQIAATPTNIFVDSKTTSAGLTVFRSGAGSEFGYARNWMTLANANGNVNIGTTVADPSVKLKVEGATTITGATILQTTLAVSGNATLGDNTSDSHTLNGTVGITNGLNVTGGSTVLTNNLTVNGNTTFGNSTSADATTISGTVAHTCATDTPLGGNITTLSVAGGTQGGRAALRAVNSSTFNTTGVAIETRAISAIGSASRSAGANNLTSIGVLASVSNAQINIGFQSDAGSNYFNATSGNTGVGFASGATLAEKFNVTGNTALTGNLSVSGNASLGDATSDAHTINGSIAHAGAAASASQYKLTAGGAGALSFLNYSADNVSIGLDVDFNGGSWVARDASVCWLYKLNDHFLIQGSGGNIVGGTPSAYNFLDLDLGTGDFTIAFGLDVTGDFATSGNTTLGDASASDTTTVNGTLFVRRGAGAANTVMGDGSAKDWTFYLQGNDLRLFEYTSVFGTGGADRVTFAGGGEVGIGTNAPDSMLHVRGSGGSSGLTPAAGTVATVENAAADSYLTFLNATNTMAILFGNSTSVADGQIVYTPTRTLQLKSKATTAVTLDGADTALAGALTVTGTTTLNGTTQVGDSTGESITFSNGPVGVNRYDGKHHEWNDDWLLYYPMSIASGWTGLPLGSPPYGIAMNGASSGVTPVLLTQRCGVVALDTGVDAAGNTGIVTGYNVVYFAHGAWTFEATIAVPTLSTGAEGYAVLLGFHDTINAVDQAYGTYLLYDERNVATSGPNSSNEHKWSFWTANSSTRTTYLCKSGVTMDESFSAVDTPIAAVTYPNTNVYRFRIMYDGTRCTAWSYASSTWTKIGNINTNMPTATTAPMGCGISIIKNAGTTSRAVHIDQTRLAVDFTSTRTP